MKMEEELLEEGDSDTECRAVVQEPRGQREGAKHTLVRA